MAGGLLTLGAVVTKAVRVSAKVVMDHENSDVVSERDDVVNSSMSNAVEKFLDAHVERLDCGSRLGSSNSFYAQTSFSLLYLFHKGF